MLLNITKPYQKVSLSFLARELSLTDVEVEGLLVDLILDERISARIDQINGCVLLGSVHRDLGVEGKKMQYLARWTDSLESLTDAFVKKITV